MKAFEIRIEFRQAVINRIRTEIVLLVERINIHRENGQDNLGR